MAFNLSLPCFYTYKYTATPTHGNVTLLPEVSLSADVVAARVAAILSEFSVAEGTNPTARYQYASLLYRIKHPTFVSGLDARFVQEIDAVVTAMDDYVLASGDFPIPFLSQDVTLLRSFQRSLLELDVSVMEKLRNPPAASVLVKSKTIVWNMSDRGGYEIRQSQSVKHNLPQESVLPRQDEVDLVAKCEGIRICFDPATCTYIEKEFNDLDHMDSWHSICEKIKSAITEINKLSRTSKSLILDVLNVNFPDFFMENQDFIVATEYLQQCLYNYTESNHFLRHGV